MSKRKRLGQWMEQDSIMAVAWVTDLVQVFWDKTPTDEKCADSSVRGLCVYVCVLVSFSFFPSLPFSFFLVIHSLSRPKCLPFFHIGNQLSICSVHTTLIAFSNSTRLIYLCTTVSTFPSRLWVTD